MLLEAGAKDAPPRARKGYFASWYAKHVQNPDGSVHPQAEALGNELIAMMVHFGALQ